MKNELTTSQPSHINPFQRTAMAEHINAGTIEVESARAIAEAQGKLVIAKRFPRNEALAYEETIQSCRRIGLAEDAFWSFPRGNEKVSGSSIHLARELARIWGNIDYGIRELSRKDGVSEMQAYAWDLQTNTLSTQNFTVRHWRDTRSGGYALKDERDIYELTANQGARRLRGCVFAVLPSDLVRAAEEECRKTLQGNNDEPIKDRVRKMLGGFGKLGVTAAMIEARLGHTLDTVLPEELADLREIYTSIKSGVTVAGEWFGVAGQREIETADDALAPAPAPAPAAPAEATTEPARRRRQAPRQESPAPAEAAPPPPVAAEPAPEPVMSKEGDDDDGNVFG